MGTQNICSLLNYFGLAFPDIVSHLCKQDSIFLFTGLLKDHVLISAQNSSKHHSKAREAAGHLLQKFPGKEQHSPTKMLILITELLITELEHGGQGSPVLHLLPKRI